MGVGNRTQRIIYLFAIWYLLTNSPLKFSFYPQGLSKGKLVVRTLCSWVMDLLDIYPVLGVLGLSGQGSLVKEAFLSQLWAV